MTVEVECPSGLKGIIRGLTVEEAKILTDRRAVREGRVNTMLLEASWERTIDGGPYEVHYGKPPHWPSVLAGDRFFLITKIRVATYGPVYAFRIPCGNCGEKIEWTINLDTDLEVVPYPEESIRMFKEGNRFVTKVVGPEVTFHLTTGLHEEKYSRTAKGSDNALLTGLLNRIDSVAGDENKNTVAWVKRLGLNDVRNLMAAFDEVGGGIETEIDIDCTECNAVQEVQLPFVKREFWMPYRSRSSR